MAYLLGIDTGGTYTDAAILKTDLGTGDISKNHGVIGKAKSLTTRQDFAIGIAGAARAAIEKSQCDPKDIEMVSLSTTLATNALVEGQGGRVALVAIGFEERDLKNAGLAEAIGKDPVIVIAGGHTTHGSEAAALDLETLNKKLDDLGDTVSGFAVAGYFAVRNPAHEIAVRDLIIERTGKAVTCSHELSARLNGPKRALTTVLNARLVPMITRLILATKRSLIEQGISAPLMIVRGDGALVSSEFAARRPIETILSGPAASLVGARYLTGIDQAFVNDIGGTTSDVALLENGKPSIDPDGARVGGFRTMVEAVAMHTFGLGGDSEVSLGGNTLKPTINLGPRRLVPVSLLAANFPQQVHEALEKQLKSSLNNRYDGRFALRSGIKLEAELSGNERSLYDQITDVPQPLVSLLDTAPRAAALNHLVVRGLVQVSGLTPSDAMHGAGEQNLWDKSAATKALKLFGRQRDGTGNAYCAEPDELAERIINRVQRRSAEVVLETAFHHAGKDGASLIDHPLVSETLDLREAEKQTSELVKTSIELDRPVIGLGASAYAYHPKAAELLGSKAVVPEHADVANAIGAVVGQVSVKFEVTISQPADGRFVVTGLDAPFTSEKSALEAAEKEARARVEVLIAEAASGDPHDVTTDIDRQEKRATIEGKDLLVEASIIAFASCRPAIASL